MKTFQYINISSERGTSYVAFPTVYELVDMFYKADALTL